MRKRAIVGSPDVGKSVLFNNLTKKYVTVSNYPGTTVEVSNSVAVIGVDAVVIFTNKVSHNAKKDVLNIAKSKKIPVFYVPFVGICTL
ncbi:MAG: FeoB small GTPase domain-containing protein [Thermodesulfovibrionia bacterium]